MNEYVNDYIFNRKKLIKVLKKIDTQEIPSFQKKLEKINSWVHAIYSGTIYTLSEKNLQGAFLTSFFQEILDYSFPTSSKIENGYWTLEQEPSTLLDGSKPDGSLGFFTKQSKDTRVVIELKDARTELDKKQRRKNSYLTPIEQAFYYFSKYENCKWIIVSNFIEIRLYSSHTMLRYEKFLIKELIEEEQFLRFYYLFTRKNLINQYKNSIIDELYLTNEVEQENITKIFYNEYRDLRLSLFNDLAKNNEIGKVLLLEKCQKILDRVIFICFCRDKDLLPSNILTQVLQAATISFNVSNNKIWSNLKDLFESIDKGNPPMNITRFNGGLFKEDKILDSLIISDEIMSKLDEAMDFWTDDRIDDIEDKKRQSIENPEKFLDDYSKAIREYQEFKESEEYLSSICGEVMEIMKSFGKVSGYNDIFIPAMRRLSPSYEEYYQNLLKANMVFLERFPDFK